MDKLTETLGVRVTPELQQIIRGVAESHGMTPGEWCRVVIEAELRREHDRYVALHSIFGSATAQAKVSEASHG